jgi:hypothetical protein
MQYVEAFFLKKPQKTLDRESGRFLDNPKEIGGGKNDYDFQ